MNCHSGFLASSHLQHSPSQFYFSVCGFELFFSICNCKVSLALWWGRTKEREFEKAVSYVHSWIEMALALSLSLSLSLSRLFFFSVFSLRWTCVCLIQALLCFCKLQGVHLCEKREKDLGSVDHKERGKKYVKLCIWFFYTQVHGTFVTQPHTHRCNSGHSSACMRIEFLGCKVTFKWTKCPWKYLFGRIICYTLHLPVDEVDAGRERERK